MTGSRKRISDWKGIAAYFGRDERTVRRWERQRGLPVHRIAGGARNLVYAYEDELEAWLNAVGSSSPNGADAGQPPAAPPPGSGRLAPQSIRWLATGAVVALLIGIVGLAAVTQDAFIAPDAVARAPHVPSPEVEALYLDATYHLATRQEAGFQRAIAGLTEATRRDPEYAAAFASLAEAYNTVSQFTLMPADEAYPLAKEAAERAIALDPALAHGYAALAFNTFYWERDFERSRALFEQAIALDPDVAQVRHWFALTSMVTGDFPVALREIAAAQSLNPESRAIVANKALIQFHAGMVADAVRSLEALAGSEPNLRSPPEYLATIYLDQRNYALFLDQYRKAAEISGNDARKTIVEAAAAGFAQSGGQGLLSAMFEAQKIEHAAGREPAYKLAATAALLGDTDAAFAYLDAATAAEEPNMIGVLIDPAFRSLRGDDRYAQIVQRVGFAN